MEVEKAEQLKDPHAILRLFENMPLEEK